MATICTATTKGGAGKTTLLINLAAELRRGGYSVAIVDADPQQHAARWALHGLVRPQDLGPELAEGRHGITVAVNVGDRDIMDRIIDLGARKDAVLVDLQGSANQAMLMAFGVADLVLVPVQPSEYDIDGAVTTLRSVKAAREMTRRPIEARVVLTRTSPSFATRAARETRQAFERAAVPLLGVEFLERVAFKEATFTGAAPSLDDPTSPAAKNVAALCAEVLALLARSAAESITA
ncbi:MAG: ParA family protein [Alphaproteobacteria bacterium]|nr:ParA family protein [Alphaproteobacteria bacterium]